MKKQTLFFIVTAGLISFGSALQLSSEPILFKSLESATKTGSPVFNRVQFIPGWNQDVWMMQQSHQGLGPSFQIWDRLAIVLDKTSKPYQAKFYQLSPGKLIHEPTPLLAPLKARCFACHSNGPRAIRPDLSTQGVKLSFLERARIQLWNLRVKTYGRVDSLAGEETEGGAPFRSKLPILAQPLKLKSCVRCHSKEGIRKPLELEHLGTAHFLVHEGLMPPFPFRAHADDVKLLNTMTGN
jgi:hypothetical protein